MGWMSIKPIIMHVIVMDNSDIKSISDLKGKRVGMGQPGGTSMLDADFLMRTNGLEPGKDFKDFRVKLPAMVNMLGDGQLDALIWNGSPPMPPVIKLKSQHKVRILIFPGKYLQRFVHLQLPILRVIFLQTLTQISPKTLCRIGLAMFF